MPTFSPWLSKPIKKPMKNKQEDTKISLCPHCNCMTHTIEGLCGKCMNTKIKPDWEDLNKQLDTYWATIDKTEGGHQIIKEIKPIIYKAFMKQEEQHKKEMIKRVEHQAEYNGILIKQLKQQHRAELEGLRMERRDAEFKCDQEDHECRMALREVKSYNTVVDEFNEAITNLLEQKGK